MVKRKKIIKKVKKKLKKKVKRPVKGKKTKSPLKVLQTALTKLMPTAHPISLFHLAVAVSRKYKFFLTGDEVLLKKVKVLQKKFQITVSSNPYEYRDMIAGRKMKKNPMEFYL